MFCPNCGAESEERQQFCRKCGVNLGLIGKALTLSESIARGDRGPLPKVKEIMQNLKLDHVSEEIGRGLEQMNHEIVHSFGTERLREIQTRSRERRTADVQQAREEMLCAEKEKKKNRPWWFKDETPAERRQRHIVEGTQSLFGGVATMIALYYFATAIVLHIPVEVVNQIPVDIATLVHNIWILGLIPTLKGIGELAGVVAAGRPAELPAAPVPAIAAGEPAVTGSLGEPPPYEPPSYEAPPSVTEGTTELFDGPTRRDSAERTPAQ